MTRQKKLQSPIREFLDKRRIAVAGVSRSGTNEVANVIYRRLRDSGYQVFAINPHTTSVEGDDCYADLAAVPGGVEAVFVATHPDVTPEVVSQCVELGVGLVWLHRSFGAGSVSEEAVALGERHGVRVIPGGCPMMFLEPVDLGHRCMRWLLSLTGKLPRAA